MATVGIDLGTTYCAVAHLDDRGRPLTLPNRDGDILTPSAVYLTDDHRAVVGQPALDLALEQPERVATLIKRRMGHADFGREVIGRRFRPETLSAVILKKLVADAAHATGGVENAVITVPAYFDDTRRKATEDAGRIAGLNVLDIVDEPSAAALAYNFSGDSSGEARTALVYDLGGGTFDVTLVKLGKKRFQVLAIEGDVLLGGRDFDDRVVAHAAGQFQALYGSDPREDGQSLAAMQASAERAKRTLSKLDRATVTVTHAGQKLQVPLTREEFEALTADLLLRTRFTTSEVLSQAGLTWDRVDKVLMVGGSTHMPGCGRMLAALTGREPDRSLAVSEVVARGAAVHAGIVLGRRATSLAGQGPLGDVVEISVNAHSLGVEVRDGEALVNDKLIKKNTQLPAHAVRLYRTAKPGQSRVRVRVLQGEAQQAAACIAVGDCWIDDLPADLPSGAPVEVRCGVAANGLIEVTATDKTSGRQVTTTLKRKGGLSDADIARERDWVATLDVQ